MTRRRLVWAAGALATLLFALWSLLWLVADLSAFRARAWAETWGHQSMQAAARGAAYEPRAEDWAQARADAERAVRLSPANADYHELLGVIHELRHPLAYIGDEAARPAREQALVHFRAAVERRPTWPYVRARLAYALLRLDRVDAELEATLSEAARLGPWEPPVMLAIVDIGLDAWFRLSPEARQVVSDTLVRSQSWAAGRRGQKHADMVWERVQAHRKQALACSLLPMNDERNRRLCHPDNW